MNITSLQNPTVKYIVKLREDKRQRQRDGVMLVEGCDELTSSPRQWTQAAIGSDRA